MLLLLLLFLLLFEEVKSDLPYRSKRAVELATEKGASSWLTVLPLKDMDFTLNKREFKDAFHLRYDWDINDTPSVGVCGEVFNTDHAMICRRGGFIIQRHNEVHDLEAEMLNMVCYDVEVEPVLQEITGEMLPRGVNKAPNARLDIHARGFWNRQSSAFFDVRVCHPNAESYKDLSPEQIYRLDIHARGFWDRQSSAFFDVRVCHPNAESYKDLSPEQIYRQHEMAKSAHAKRSVMEIEQGTFTPLVFSTTGGMAEECRQYHCRLAQLLAMKKGEHYSTTVAWVRTKVSFAILRSAILCLRGSRTIRRRNNLNINDIDMEID